METPLIQATTPSLGSSTLLLFPTELERRRFDDLGGIPVGNALQAIAGFGPIAAAARTAQLLSSLRPRRVVLIGIAGAYDVDAHPVGTALEFDEVAIDGIGVGEGDTFQGPPALGFPQWPGSPGTRVEKIEERLPLAPAAQGKPGRLLLSTCAASEDAAHAARRRARFPDALAEDMEGFGVALACALQGVPLRIVRGISNLVGDRDPTSWRIPAAIAVARRRVLELFEEDQG